ncbi:transposase family protein [Paenibacillus sp. FSL H7-0331]|uniref:transposase family protein n=1 Tax=Paenibacillus sp. FSL H7-0331 TaxID=1920421 RepID=UPI00096EEAAA|nr:transposase family protein [Paenibacillus sp. FSL H7-0331]OMF16340.1 hypothetical protein BK127_13035 [Paenibacillus sp. FSL H7-0331]
MNEIHLETAPTAYKQACPICYSEAFVKRNGSNNPRKIRHLAVFGKKSYLCVPSIRMVCSCCQIGFVWTYGFVGPKRSGTTAFFVPKV